MTAAAQPELRKELGALFIAPFASHGWESARGRSHWVELEGWQDSIAGPLSAIADTGGCGYVYAREDWYFGDVGDPVALRARLLEWLAGLLAGVGRFSPTTSAEATDLVFMRAVTYRIGELVEQACRVEQARWSAEMGHS